MGSTAAHVAAVIARKQNFIEDEKNQFDFIRLDAPAGWNQL